MDKPYREIRQQDIKQFKPDDVQGLLEFQDRQITLIGFFFQALKRALIKKGLITEKEIDDCILEVEKEIVARAPTKEVREWWIKRLTLIELTKGLEKELEKNK